MINPDLKNGEIQIQSTEIAVTSPDLKQVIPLELSNIDTNTPNILALGFDASIMMEIVANSMYKDKTIVLQEIPANARDGIIRRIELGDNNFKPEILINYNSLTYEISISDNGSGMTREVIEKVYRFFGRSDKRNTLNEVGMFGVGSKTPFALVDEYEVSTISMFTHKKLSFIVTKRGIIITEDEIPTDKECGTVVKFTISSGYSIYDIKNRIKKTVSTWLCPVYFIEDNDYKELLSYKFENIPLSDIKNGFYKGLIETKLKYESPDFSFYLKNSDRDSNIFIGHIPYKFEMEWNIGIDVILHNPNLLSLSATREGLEKDSKYNEFIKLIKNKIMEMLLPNFDKFFKYLPDNIKNISDMDENLFNYFIKLSEDKLINQKDYPYFDIIRKPYKYYSIHEYIRTRNLYTILKSHEKAFYTTKKLTFNTASLILDNLPSNSAVIICPDECNKLCLFCPEYDINYHCDKDKKSLSLLINFIKPLPYLNIPSKEKIKRTITSFNGISLYNHKNNKYNIELDKDEIIITKEEIDTNLENIVLVKEKIFDKLVKLGWKTITPEAYPTYIRNNLKFKTIEGKEINGNEFKKYKTIIHGLNNYKKMVIDVIKIFYPKKTLLLNDYIDNKNVEELKNTNQEFIRGHELEKIFFDRKENLEVKLSIPLSKLINFSMNLRDGITINKIKRKT